MKRVLTYGTFDLFHVGHIRLLERARSLGDYLLVGLSTDEFNLGKGKKSVFSYSERFAILSAIKHVDKSFPKITGSRNWTMCSPTKLTFSSWETTGWASSIF
jgi:glycerol-3-phosphate cytidylyltransferase